MCITMLTQNYLIIIQCKATVCHLFLYQFTSLPISIFFLIETFGPTQLLPLHQIKLFVLLYSAKHPLLQRKKTGKDPRTIITYHPYNQ